MADIFHEAVDLVKRLDGALLNEPMIERAMRQAGHVWRRGELGPAQTVGAFIRQVLHGNVSCQAVTRLGGAGRPFTASAYCQARSRLPLEGLQRVLRLFNNAALATAGRAPQEPPASPDAASVTAAQADDALWLGHRVLYVDGSNVSMPDAPALRAHFGQPSCQKPGCGFPIAHILVQVHARSGLLTQMIASPMRTHDMSVVQQALGSVSAGDVVLGDAAFSNYAHTALLRERGAHGLFPNHQRRIVDFTPRRPHADPRASRSGRGKGSGGSGGSGGGSKRKKESKRRAHRARRQAQEHKRQADAQSEAAGRPRSRFIRKLGRKDQLVEWLKPAERPRWMPREQYDALPDSITVRELRRKVRRPDGRTLTVTLVTTLLDPKLYPAKKLVKLMERRWEVEVNLRHLKTTMGMEVLKCKSLQNVLKELAVYALVYNLIRLAMHEAAARQQVPPSRISFKDALTWLRHARGGSAAPPVFLVNPCRPERLEPRVRKRRPKQYALMTKPRDELRKELKEQGIAA